MTIEEAIARVHEMGANPAAWPWSEAFLAAEARSLLPRMARALELAVAALGNHVPYPVERRLCRACDKGWPCDEAEALAAAEQAISGGKE